MKILKTRDIDRILPLNQMVQSEHAIAHPEVFRSDWDEAAVRAYWQDLLGKGAVTLFLATRSGVDLGYAAVKIDCRAKTPFSHARLIGVLDHIAVAQKAQRQGVAGVLMVASMEFMRTQGAQSWQANVWGYNHASAGLMKAFGATLANQNYVGRL